MLRITGFFCLSLLALMTWRYFQPEGILFYQGIVVSVIASVFSFFMWRDKREAAIVFLLLYSFIFTVPVTVDRSYSVQMLNLIARSSEGVELSQILEVFSGDEAKALRRVEEQIKTGSVERHDDKIKITFLGEVLAASFGLISHAFSTGNR